MAQPSRVAGGLWGAAPRDSGGMRGGTATPAKRFFTGLSTTIGGADAFLPTITISAFDLPVGGTYALSNVSGTGFTVLFKNYTYG